MKCCMELGGREDAADIPDSTSIYLHGISNEDWMGPPQVRDLIRV